DGEVITQSDKTGSHGPVNYLYDKTRKEWMYQWPQGDPINHSTASTTAHVAYTTVGGLPVFTGSSKAVSMFIPLSPNKMLFIYDAGAVNSQYLGYTVMRYGQQLSPSVEFQAEAALANEYFGGKSTYADDFEKLGKPKASST